MTWNKILYNDVLSSIALIIPTFLLQPNDTLWCNLVLFHTYAWHRQSAHVLIDALRIGLLVAQHSHCLRYFLQDNNHRGQSVAYLAKRSLLLQANHGLQTIIHACLYTTHELHQARRLAFHGYLHP